MKSFQTLGVTETFTAALHKQGIKTATPVQEKAIPPAFTGKDLIVQAQTGTGKTLAFLLPALQRVKTSASWEQVLIMTPTRELTRQIMEVASLLTAGTDIDVLPLIGGKTIEKQLHQLRRRPHVIIGTPGRLLDHCQRNSLTLSGIQTVILDEADQMLHMGFLDEVEQVIEKTGKNRQLLLFSATMPDRIRKLAKKYMSAPLSLTVQEGQQITLDRIEQRVYMVDQKEKYSRLTEMMKETDPYLAVIFCNTKEGAAKLAGQLIQDGFNIGELHGDLSQGKRIQVLRDFAKARTQYLVATDIAARGIDVEGVTHVFNYDVPHDVDYYTHRIGRTGRAGQTGLAVTFAAAEDTEWVRRIEHNIQATITKYTADGQIKVMAKSTPPKKKKAVVSKLPASTYQPTTAKRAKQAHKGGNNRRRRAKPAEDTAKRRQKRR